MSLQHSSNVDLKEVEKFSLSSKGSQHSLLELMLPIKMQYILSAVPKTSKVLDVGCNIGLICECLTRAGYSAGITGIEASPSLVQTAHSRAKALGFNIEYHNSSVEALAYGDSTHGDSTHGDSAHKEGTNPSAITPEAKPGTKVVEGNTSDRQYGAILALDIIEHVPNVPMFMRACISMLAPGGRLIICTINSTLRARLLAKYGAEHLLRLLPVGTHDPSRFISPGAILQACEGLASISNTTGIRFNPITRKFSFCASTALNYITTLTKA